MKSAGQFFLQSTRFLVGKSHGRPVPCYMLTAARSVRTPKKAVSRRKQDSKELEEGQDEQRVDLNSQVFVDTFHEVREEFAVAQTSRNNASSPSSSSSPPSSSSSSSSVAGAPWSWIPPRVVETNASLTFEGVSIPSVPGQLLTADELMAALTKMGGTDIKKIDFETPLDTMNYFLIVSGLSARHLRKMSDVVVGALKERELHQALGITGAEGEDDDDWLIVDCYDCCVHFMLPDKRAHLNLEDHWKKGNVRPVAMQTDNDDEYFRHFEELLNKYPPGSTDDESEPMHLGLASDHQNNIVASTPRNKTLSFSSGKRNRR